MSPTVFIIYVRDGKRDGVIKRYIKAIVQWLQELGICVYADRSPTANLPPYRQMTSVTEAKSHDILRNQLCLLPGLPGSVDIVVLCGSTQLGEYMAHDFYEPYRHSVQEAYDKAKAQSGSSTWNDNTNSLTDVMNEHIGKVVVGCLCEDGFHHVLTETAMTEIRHRHQEISGITPMLIEGEAEQLFLNSSHNPPLYESTLSHSIPRTSRI
jgi:hypothetical protein